MGHVRHGLICCFNSCGPTMPDRSDLSMEERHAGRSASHRMVGRCRSLVPLGHARAHVVAVAPFLSHQTVVLFVGASTYSLLIHSFFNFGYRCELLTRKTVSLCWLGMMVHSHTSFHFLEMSQQQISQSQGVPFSQMASETQNKTVDAS